MVVILFLFLAMLPLLGQQVQPPQIALTGNIGQKGSFPLFNNGTIQIGNADYTMQYPDMTASVLRITSSTPLTATRSVIAPQPFGFEFVVQNATTGGQSIIFKGTSGGGVTIPNGQAMLLISDGTNYVSASGISTGAGGPPTGVAGGDFSGTYPNPTVTGLLGSHLPTSGAGYLTWSGTSWNFSPFNVILTLTANSPGVDICGKINNAIISNTVNGSSPVIDARLLVGTQPCASSPYDNVQASSAILFGDGAVIQITKPWVAPSDYNALLIGAGRGSNGRGTNIMAVAGFPATCDGLTIGCPMLRFGNGHEAFGQRMENMTLDCNGVAGCIGFYSTDINELSGAYHFQIINFPVMGIFIDGSGNGAAAGVYPAQHYVLFDGEVYALTYGNSSTVGVKLIGGNKSNGGEQAPRLIEAITSSGNAGHEIGTAYIFDGFWGGSLIGLNAENASVGYQFGDAMPLNGTNASNLRCGNVQVECVWIKSVAPYTNNLVLMSVTNTPTVAPITIKDDMLSINISDASVGLHVIGNGYSTGGFSYLSTSSTYGGAILNTLNLKNNRDISQVLRIDGGTSMDVDKGIQFQDRGTPKWTMESTAANDQFLLWDHINNRARLWFDTTGAAYMNSSGGYPVSINKESNNGTGGLEVCSGGASPACNFAVNGTTGALSSGGQGGITQNIVVGANVGLDCTLVVTGGIITGHYGTGCP